MHQTILEQFKKDFKLNENDLFIIQYIIEHSEEIISYSSHQLATENTGAFTLKMQTPRTQFLLFQKNCFCRI